MRDHREHQCLSLTELAKRCGIDSGNLSRIERGERLPPKMPVLFGLLKALGIAIDSDPWHELMSAAARSRLEIVKGPFGTYLPYENTLHGLPEPAGKIHTYTVTEAASELGRIQATLGIKKIIIEAADGSKFVFPIDERPAGKGKKS
jgi:transcriptional regulator with XRE-family HTH domain